MAASKQPRTPRSVPGSPAAPASLAGQVAVITGSTQGLGEATARLFAQRGAAGLVICGRSTAPGRAIAKELSAAGCPTVFVKADLERVADCRKVIAQADSTFGRVDCLVNSAGITDRGTILDTSPALFDRMFAVNLRAPFFLMQEAIKRMRRAGQGGSIINIASMSAHGGQPFITAYCASKGGLVNLTKNVAFSLLRERIRVNCLNVGWMDTPGEDRIQRVFHGADDRWLRKAERGLPLGRLVKPDEVARTIAFLASAESGLMTGAIIDFDQAVLGAYEAAPQPTPLPPPQT